MKPERVLFINIIKQCNMHCDRCYLTIDSRKDPRLLTQKALEAVLSSSWAKDAKLTLIWEGGEAALAGSAHFEDMVNHASYIAPWAKQTMVTNLFHLPEWLIDLSCKYFDSKIETTFALDGKYNLAFDRDQFLDRFSKNFKKASSRGLSCPINLELNDKTIAMGAGTLIDYLADLGQARVEFDISIDFEAFLKDPAYTLHGYPMLPLTAQYDHFADFIGQFVLELDRRGLQDVITSSLIEEMKYGKVSTMFGVQRGSDFLTLNPDNTLTTNPLFSDLVPTFLGNVLTDDVEALLSCKKRQHFIRHEIRKTQGCMRCEYYDLCSGGPSHAPTFDSSNECAGMKSLRTLLRSPQ